MDIAERFLKDYPTISAVYDSFAPLQWGKAQRMKDDLATRECITLGMLDTVYGVQGAAKMVVKVNLGGIYSLGMNREVMNQQTADMAADLFVARYGNECTLYAMMIYFSGYLMDYKGTYQNYDVQDILLQFSKKFLPWFRMKQGVKEPKKEKEPTGPCGKDGLMVYLRMKFRNGENLREGGLWDNHFIDEEIVAQIEDEMKNPDAAF